MKDILFHKEKYCGICGTKGAYEIRPEQFICEEHLLKNIPSSRKADCRAMLAMTLLFVFIFCTSCGTRKRATDLEKLELEEKKVTTVEIKNDITTNIRTSKNYQITTLEPIDPTIESSFTDADGNTTKFTNSKVILDSSQKDSSATGIDRGSSTKVEKIDQSLKSKKKAVAVETKKPNPYLWGGLVIVVCFVVYLIFNRSKK